MFFYDTVPMSSLMAEFFYDTVPMPSLTAEFFYDTAYVQLDGRVLL